ncbi:MAG TPA: hypothetical protein VHE35_34170, partial [Kofleriaceae bacterium]|nr:hypothetical protein [Kofleriaceae bacterium]
SMPPVTPPPLPNPVGPPPAEVFEQEERDAAWADDHEHELAARLRAVEEDLEARGITVRIGPPECRSSRCRVTIGADDTGALGRLFDALESDQGLEGWADSILLDRVVAGDDGHLETTVTAQFERGP